MFVLKETIKLLKQYIANNGYLEMRDKYENISITKKFWIVLNVINQNKIEIFGILTHRYLWLFHVDFVITTKCTLRCKECANFLNYYKAPYNVESNILFSSLNVIERCLDSIQRVYIIGGDHYCIRVLLIL